MTIGHATQRGTLIYIYNHDGIQITNISAPGRWPDDGLIRYTPAAVFVRKGRLIYSYDETGHQAGNPYPL